ncbi:hypothetical protein [Rhizobium ruizarguesonis]|uniref:hypothetical protein n=1 Tax=Rhizobium ruizarguesonis TaxID=2081791 RepID=UPI001031392C|nr:hypothetical protein [Rhizobium ruizarguesonis]TBF29313.1 hypothetical protein ELG93_02455 [Rhizobium ruizarguesonis]
MVAGRPGNFAPLLRRVVFISESALGGGLDFKSISLCVMGGGNERVTQAIAECDRIDECKSWSDKAAALASYARQADDKTLENYAMRIRSRAIKRAGELLKEFEPQKGGDRKSEEYQTGGAGPLITRKDAAEAAGMSERQAKTAVRVANVPAEEFERQVESDTPPTVGTAAATHRVTEDDRE